MPEHLKGIAAFGYHTGWRHSEITQLSWNQVDREQGIVTLYAGETKNDQARTVYMNDELKGVVEKQWAARKANKSLIAYVFTNADGTDRVKRFDKAWKTACKNAGIGMRLFHDFRRTAVRNMVRSGIPERVAMMISGHRTRSVFDRYNIVNDADLKDVAERQEAYLKTCAGTVSGTVTELTRKRGLSTDA